MIGTLAQNFIVGYHYATNARAAAAARAAAGRAPVFAAQQVPPQGAASAGGVRAVNQAGPADPAAGTIAGLPRAVVIGGAALAGVLALVVVAKKLKKH